MMMNEFADLPPTDARVLGKVQIGRTSWPMTGRTTPVTPAHPHDPGVRRRQSTCSCRTSKVRET